MGRTVAVAESQPFIEQVDVRQQNKSDTGISICEGRVFGTYIHGLFDQSSFRRWWLNRLRISKGWEVLQEIQSLPLDVRLDRLADFVEQHLSIPVIERILEAGV
jgi:cobyric acid synthase